jgi:hypothetical protein
MRETEPVYLVWVTTDSPKATTSTHSNQANQAVGRQRILLLRP